MPIRVRISTVTFNLLRHLPIRDEPWVVDLGSVLSWSSNLVLAGILPGRRHDFGVGHVALWRALWRLLTLKLDLDDGSKQYQLDERLEVPER